MYLQIFVSFSETLNFHIIFASILKIQFKKSYYPICRWKETIHGQESATKMHKCTFFTKENLGKMMKSSLRGFASFPPTILCSVFLPGTRLTNIWTIQMTLNLLIICNIISTSKKVLKCTLKVLFWFIFVIKDKRNPLMIEL